MRKEAKIHQSLSASTKDEGKEASQTHLRPNLQHILEPNRRIRQLALQHRHDVLVVFRNLFPTLLTRVLLEGEGLKLGDLRIEGGDVLFDDVGEFLCVL